MLCSQERENIREKKGITVVRVQEDGVLVVGDSCIGVAPDIDTVTSCTEEYSHT